MRKNIITTIFVAILAMNGISQNTSNLTINGEVAGTTSENPLSGARITAYINNTEVFKSAMTNSKSQFQLILPANKKVIYKIMISHPGFMSKTIEVDTRGVPATDQSFALGQLGFLLLKENSSADKSKMEMPVAKYAYNTTAKNIIELQN